MRHFVRHYAEMVVAMFVAMAAVMLLRPAEYIHRHGVAA